MAIYSILKLLTLYVSSSVATGNKLAKFLKEKGQNEVLDDCLGDSRIDKNKGKCQWRGFRVCLKFLNDDNSPYLFGKYNSTIDTYDTTSGKKISDPNEDGLDWWEWSTQPEHKDSWIEGMIKTGGHHWCACALCTAEAVTRFGCDKLDIKCDSSDIAFLRERVETDNKTVLKPALQCLYEKCGADAQEGWPIVGKDCGHKGCARLYEDRHTDFESEALASPSSSSFASLIVGCAVVGGILIGVVFYRHASAWRVDTYDDAVKDQTDSEVE